jgi:transcriptional regulator with XRE-family HTH domain
MTIGARLKEERLRLGRTQTAFATLASVSKGAQINWEKDASSPPATALAAFRDAGADVLYILTGERSDRLAPNVPLGEQTGLGDASATLDRAERMIQAAEAWPIEAGAAEVEAIRGDLDRVARDQELPEQLRARADWILHYALGDSDAGQRYRRRTKRVGMTLKHAIRELEALEDELGWQPPRVIHHALMALHFKLGLDRDDIMDLLSAMKAALEQSVTAPPEPAGA